MTFESMYETINKAIIVTTSDKVKAVSEFIQTPLTIAMTLYVIIYGWLILRGDIEEPMTAFLKRFMKIAIIWYLIINPTVFMENFGNVILKVLPGDIGKAITGSETSDNIIDVLVEPGLYVGERVDAGSYVVEVGWKILAYGIQFVTILAGVIAFFIYALSDFVVAMLLIIAPVFICLLMYETTKQWFQGWLSTLVTFLLLKVLVVSFLSLINGITAEIVTPVKASSDFGKVAIALWDMILVYFVGFFVFIKLYDIAAAIGGGPSMGGFHNYLGAPYRAVRNAADNAFSRFRSRGQQGQPGHLTDRGGSPRPAGSVGSPSPSGSVGSPSPSGSGGSPSPSGSIKPAEPARGTQYTETAKPLGSSETSKSSGSPAGYSGASRTSTSSGSSGSSKGAGSSTTPGSYGTSAPSGPPASSESSGSSGSSGASSGSSGASGSLDHPERQRKEY